MKNVRFEKVFALDEPKKKLIEAYYLNTGNPEVYYNGKDEELLSVFYDNVSIIFLFGEMDSNDICKFDCTRGGNISFYYNNVITDRPLKYDILFKNLVCNGRKLNILNTKVPDFVLRDLTTIMYILDFKKRFEYKQICELGNIEGIIIGNIITKVETFNNAKLHEIIYFPFIPELKKIDIDVLPEFVITFDALKKIEKKVKDAYREKEPIYPFSEFVITISGMAKILARLNADKSKLQVMFYDNYDTPLYVASCDSTLSYSYTMYAFADIMEYIDDKEPQKLASGIFTYIYIILYYYSYYKIEYEIVEKEKTVKEKVNYSKKGKNHRKSNVTTVIVPRKVVRMSSERALSARKRSKPLYSVKSWTRATHIRRYRDKNGKVIKEIVIKESVCNRRKDLVQSVSDENSTQSKKIFKIDDESIKKAKKQ